jgi:hypothetical protein
MSLSILSKKMQTLNKLRNAVGIKGLLKGVIYSYNQEIILEKDLNNSTEFYLKDNLKIERIEKKHLSNLVLLRKEVGIGENTSIKELNEYLNNNCNGFIAKLNGKIIGYIWWRDDKMKSSFGNSVFKFYTKEIKLNPHDTYAFDFLISPQYRGSSHAIEFLSKVLITLKKLGYKKNFGYVAACNLPARWTYKLLGYKEIKIVEVIRFFLFIGFRNKKIFFENDFNIMETWGIK